MAGRIRMRVFCNSLEAEEPRQEREPLALALLGMKLHAHHGAVRDRAREPLRAVLGRAGDDRGVGRLGRERVREVEVVGRGRRPPSPAPRPRSSRCGAARTCRDVAGSIPGSSRFTWPRRTASPAAPGASSLDSKSTCIPRQIPRYGRPPRCAREGRRASPPSMPRGERPERALARHDDVVRAPRPRRGRA